MRGAGATSSRFRVDSMPPGLAVLLSAGLLAAGGSPELHAQRETVGKSSDSPFELIAPGRTLTVIVPNREAEIRHAGGSVPSESSQIHRVLIRRFAEQHYLDVDWVQVDNWDALVPSLIAGKGDLIAADITVTEPRKEKVAFTVPAHRTREHIVVRKGDRINRRSRRTRNRDPGAIVILARGAASAPHSSGNRCPFRTGAHAVGTTAGGHRRRSV